MPTVRTITPGSKNTFKKVICLFQMEAISLPLKTVVRLIITLCLITRMMTSASSSMVKTLVITQFLVSKPLEVTHGSILIQLRITLPPMETEVSIMSGIGLLVTMVPLRELRCTTIAKQEKLHSNKEIT